MKTTMEQRCIPVYHCEYCGQKAEREVLIVRCESECKSKQCDHEDIKHTIRAVSYCDHEESYICKSCVACGKELTPRFASELMKNIFEIQRTVIRCDNCGQSLNTPRTKTAIDRWNELNSKPFEKNCTSCKWEPEWDKYNNGYCKIIPMFMFVDEMTKTEGSSVEYYSKIITDCNLWEAK